ncbi:hypothetical protein C0033_09225 [Clostridium sp. chh4-2]|nr:hypothetical protein C0033_09225 [Clostridium sp. chh4-2]
MVIESYGENSWDDVIPFGWERSFRLFFTSRVKAFSEKPSPFNLKPQGFSENAFTLDVKKFKKPLDKTNCIL